MKLIRVFPRRTNATPVDDLVRIGVGPELFDECDEVHISVTWTWDLPKAEELYALWKPVHQGVRIGGPATGEKGEAFTPGLYIKHGYTITSRGCPNHCWFCSVPIREGTVREYPIQDGWNVLDDNLLACSESHIRAVFAMLKRQSRKPEFTGGLEAARMKPWIASELKALKAKQLFFAYDTADDLEPLIEAGKMMRAAGFTTASHSLRCYVLCGWKKGPGGPDTFEAARKRLKQAQEAGYMPMAMAMGDPLTGKKDKAWARFAREWIRPRIINARKA